MAAAKKKKAAPAKKTTKAKPAAKAKAKAKPAAKAKAKAKPAAKPKPQPKPKSKPQPKPKAAPKVRKSTLHRDKLILPPQPMVERHRNRLLIDGEKFGSATLALHNVAELELPTGELVTADPFLVDGAALSRKVAPGAYPVTLSVAAFGDDQRVVAASVRFRAGAPVRWEAATFAGVPRKKGGEPGYPVDALTGSFMDTATQAKIKDEPGGWPTPSFKALEKQLLTEHYQPNWGWASYHPDPAARGNCVAFSSGWGDGVYSSYWGLDEGGEPLCLLTDFEAFTDEDWTT